jgi:phosphoserine phosphatase
MNVYDFDKTIYNGDSSADLIKYALLKHPAALRVLPAAAWYGLRYLLRLSDKEAFKEKIFAIVRFIPDINGFLEAFWAEHERKLSPWYLNQKSEDDIIVSASSRFALEPICRKLNIKLIATEVDSKTGRFNGPNCHGEEKVRRFRLFYPESVIDSFYSDSRSDEPLAKNAKKAFIVRKEKIKPWDG